MMMATGGRSVVESLKDTSKGKLRYNPNFVYHAKVSTEEQKLVVPLPLSSPPKAKSNKKAMSPLMILENLRYDATVKEVKCELKDSLTTSPVDKTIKVRQQRLQVSTSDVAGLLVYHKMQAQSHAKAEGKQRKEEFLAGVQQIKLESECMLDELNAKNDLRYQKEVIDLNNQQSRTVKEEILIADLVKKHKNRTQFAIENQEKIKILKNGIIAKKKLLEEARKEKLDLSNKLENLAVGAREVFRNIDSVLKSYFDSSDPCERAKAIYTEAFKEYKNVIDVANNAINKQDGLKEACIYAESTVEILNALREKLSVEIGKLEDKKKEDNERKIAELRADEEKKAEEEKQKEIATREAASKPQPLDQSSTSSSKQELNYYVSPFALKNYEETLKFQQEVYNSYADLINTKNEDPTTLKMKKAYRFDLSKVINTPINAISDQSPAHLIDKIERLTKLLSGQALELGGKLISAKDHPSGLAYCKDVVAKKLVLQGARQISSSFNSAFSFAAVALGIWAEFPDVGNLILAHLYIACPYLVPYYVPKRPEQSLEDYFKTLGYEVDGKDIESEDKYLKKLSGIIRLYAAIVQSPMPPQLSSVSHPHGIHNAWTWLTRLLNLQPRDTVTATILFDFLEVAGYALFKTYGKQFQKLLKILCQEIMPKIDEVTPAGQKGPVVRLRSFLEKCIKGGSIPLPDGYLSSRWWKQ